MFCNYKKSESTIYLKIFVIYLLKKYKKKNKKKFYKKMDWVYIFIYIVILVVIFYILLFIFILIFGAIYDRYYKTNLVLNDPRSDLSIEQVMEKINQQRVDHITITFLSALVVSIILIVIFGILSYEYCLQKVSHV